MILKNLTLRDKEKFDACLSGSGYKLSAYAFQNIYIWSGLFEIFWARIDKSLCVFFKDKIAAFVYLEPLTGKNPGVIRECFGIMDRFNKNKDFSRIDNIPAENTGFYEGLGFKCSLSGNDYLCRREPLVALSGDKLRHKRSSCNYFTKNYKSTLKDLQQAHKKECLALYELWMQERQSLNPDPVYRGMLKDSHAALKIALQNYETLGFRGKVVRVDNRIRAFTLGYPLNARTFCVLYEIADLSFKGIAQYIFREFCRELEGFEFINIMDDSGLKSLEKVKLSYSPQELVSAYTAQRK